MHENELNIKINLLDKKALDLLLDSLQFRSKEILHEEYNPNTLEYSVIFNLSKYNNVNDNIKKYQMEINDSFINYKYRLFDIMYLNYSYDYATRKDIYYINNYVLTPDDYFNKLLEEYFPHIYKYVVDSKIINKTIKYELFETNYVHDSTYKLNNTENCINFNNIIKNHFLLINSNSYMYLNLLYIYILFFYEQRNNIDENIKIDNNFINALSKTYKPEYDNIEEFFKILKNFENNYSLFTFGHGSSNITEVSFYNFNIIHSTNCNFLTDLNDIKFLSYLYFITFISS
jgi:hypothetical protein